MASVWPVTVTLLLALIEMLFATPSALSVGFLPLMLTDTSSPLVGTWPWLQFVFVFQSLLVVPLKMFVTACAGEAANARTTSAMSVERVMLDWPPQPGIRPPSGGCGRAGRRGLRDGRARRAPPPRRRPWARPRRPTRRRFAAGLPSPATVG